MRRLRPAAPGCARLRRAAEAWLAARPEYREFKVRFDVFGRAQAAARACPRGVRMLPDNSSLAGMK
jgi:Holliday junction resolvase-like predicted endonuclease